MENGSLEQENAAPRDPHRELLSIVGRHARKTGPQDTAIPRLRVIRETGPTDIVHTIYKPALCIVLQGAKTVALAGERYRYDRSSYLVASVHIPVAGSVVQASPEEPYVSLQLQFGAEEILDLIQAPAAEADPEADAGRGIWVNPVKPDLLDALLRLVRLLDAPADIPVLAPLFIRETLYRVLQDERNERLKQFAVIGSHAAGIVKAIRLIGRDIARPLRVEELAHEANMSASALHKHFKRVTAMSPLQYQKAIRLQEARRLLIAEERNAADAAFEVGYESPSQFSREYARMFGLPPASDAKQHRGELHV
ncbi:AraC family transcriptional regulator [Cohnella sp. JJ-181]|uniref:AraC family transcriptional regulator n=1 Tax=Cohnella rhizoplanae TaxID=2974897 RepID=UPI0022FFBC83|nr:AraC family transcriptional regulator [Cohnella sp. JJ-181]CAI6081548.1 HTH-type transcriptional activator RhaR [Cohnella sp. JJ-181]